MSVKNCNQRQPGVVH